MQTQATDVCPLLRVTSECSSKWLVANTQRRTTAHLSNTYDRTGGTLKADGMTEPPTEQQLANT